MSNHFKINERLQKLGEIDPADVSSSSPEEWPKTCVRCHLYRFPFLANRKSATCQIKLQYFDTLICFLKFSFQTPNMKQND